MTSGCSEPNKTVLGTHQAAILDTAFSWSSTEEDNTYAVALADLDQDGDLDIAVGNNDTGPSATGNRIYENDAGTFLPIWESSELDATEALAWGDWDNDGDLDLATGNGLGDDRVYTNNGGTLVLAWTSTHSEFTRDLAWGDWDNDGDLDLATASYGSANRLYTNDAGDLTSIWTSDEADNSRAVAWADWDGDGDLDLAVANGGVGSANRVYENDGGTLTSAWVSTETDPSLSVAWGDWDDDGDPDLAFGNETGQSRVYENSGGDLSLAWSSPITFNAHSVDWADWDGDGDLDLAISHAVSPGQEKVFENDGGTLSLAWTAADPLTGSRSHSMTWGDLTGDGAPELVVGDYGVSNLVYTNISTGPVASWSADDTDNSQDVAWGDWDGDGDLDLAVAIGGGNASNRVYANEGGEVASSPAWSSLELENTQAVAWGDFDQDGDLDLGVANQGQPTRVYENSGGDLISAWTSTETDSSPDLAWGDFDGDQDLDLVVANTSAFTGNRLYINDGGSLSLHWTSPENEDTQSVAWGDVDNDGDLDLAVGNDGSANRLYENNGGALTSVWTSTEASNSRSVAWSDIDGDGDLDLAVGNNNQVDQVYLNDGGTLEATASWTSTEAGPTRSLSFSDFDGDGDMDLATSSLGSPPERIYRNQGDGLETSASWSSSESHTSNASAWGDMDADGDPDLASAAAGVADRIYVNHRHTTARLPNNPTIVRVGDLDTTANAPGGMSAGTVTIGANVVVPFVLTDPEGDPAPTVRLEYSLSGGGSWLPATVSGDTTDLTADDDGEEHQLTWDMAADNAEGDNIVLRVLVETQAPNFVARPLQHGVVSAVSASARLYVSCFPLDADQDTVPCTDDCDDTDDTIYPGATETVDDGIDQDCNGFDTITCFQDDDDDDFGSTTTITADDGDCTDTGESTSDQDCNDTDDTIYPGATETPDDGIDQDCNGFDTISCFEDLDGDGFGSTVTITAVDGDCADAGESVNDQDCNDGDSGIYPAGDGQPGGTEIPDDGIDQDCNGFDTITCFEDLDLDGFGSTATITADDGDCTDPGESEVDTDCDDTRADSYPPEGSQPGGTEIADDGFDQDCSGTDSISCFEDLDEDGFGSTTTITADDGDCDDPGESINDQDCDDTDAEFNPNAADPPGDGLDQNCNSVDSIECFEDLDEDGFGSTVTVTAEDADCADDGESVNDQDCDDDDPDIYPAGDGSAGGTETPDDGIDQDCNGFDTITCFEDLDLDGFGTTVTITAADGDCDDSGESYLDTDCDDTRADSYPPVGDQPGGTEIIADGIDQDCDGFDTLTCFADLDLDGFGSTVAISAADGDCADDGESINDQDCDDTDPNSYPAGDGNPGGTETPDDGIDQDCNGWDTITCFQDLDEDGFGSTATITASDGDCTDIGESDLDTDCDDDDGSIYPGAPETTGDAIDQDCNSFDTVRCFQDSDEDGFGSTTTITADDGDCADTGESDLDTDCDDTDDTVYPGAPDTADDGVDQDCSGFETISCFEDLDGDSYGSSTTVLASDGDCTDAGESEVDTDCDDDDANVSPAVGTESCNGVDDNCDGVVPVDEVDEDEDSWRPCDSPADCWESSPLTHPGAEITYPTAPEVYDGVDNDCDGTVDEETEAYDDDGDGFTELGDPDDPLSPSDCDDDDEDIHPAALEIEDEIDNDCDGVVDNDTASYDDDGDCYCEAESCLGSTDPDCDEPQPGDCDDEDESIHPDATDSEDEPDGIDDNCDGLTDGYDGPDDEDEDGWSVGAGDCDDSDPEVHPGASETVNDLDDDCDGIVDNETEAYDDDGDGYSELDGDCVDSDPALAPDVPELLNGIDDNCDGQVDENTDAADDDGDGFSEFGGDCDDSDPTIHPGAPEQADAIDQDCDGRIDEGTSAWDNDGDGLSADEGDCDDTDPWTSPEAEEVCDDELDNNCDEEVDEDCEDEGSINIDVRPSSCGGCGRCGAATPVQPSGWISVALAFGVMGFRRRRSRARPSMGKTHQGGSAAPVARAGLLVMLLLSSACKSDITVGAGLSDLSVTPGVIDLGSIAPGDSVTVPVYLDNVGSYSLHVPSMSLQGGDQSLFSLEGETSFSLARGEGLEVQITYSPAQIGLHTTDLVINSDSGDANQRTVVVRGQAGRPMARVYPLTLDFGTAASTLPVQIASESSVPVTLEAITLDDPAGHFAIVLPEDAEPPLTATSLEPLEVDIAFEPGAGAAAHGTLTLELNDPDATQVAVTLLGNIECDSDLAPNDDSDGDGFSPCGGDCDDTDEGIHPGAPELADNLDNDCDDTIDEGTDDYDDDGDGLSEAEGDCVDDDATIHPGADETYNGIDDDCDGIVDDGTGEIDHDQDGFAEVGGDCDDDDAARHPAAPELGDAIDNNCNGIVDEGTEYYDDDGDCYCETSPCAGSVEPSCTSPVGDDCQDQVSTVHPGATEAANGVDDDCDELVDEGTTLSDDDGDGFSEYGEDCNDANDQIHPNATEIPGNGVDEDCDGSDN